jgi:hypothetical protein
MDLVFIARFTKLMLDILARSLSGLGFRRYRMVRHQLREQNYALQAVSAMGFMP